MSADKRQPWMRFYTADWRGDAGLRAVGYAARGLWIDMISLMHEATPYGHLVLNDKPLDAARLAARLGGSAKEVQALLQRLEEEGVFSRNDDGVIFSRRMVADAAKAERDKVNGSGGGNPNLKRNLADNVVDMRGVNPLDNAKVKAHARTCAHVPETREQKLEAEEPEAEKDNRSLRSLPQRAVAKADDFETWWAGYPRKVGKDAARRAYAAAVKRGAEPHVMAEAIAVQSWNEDPKFIPHPATWLNGGRWQDDPDAGAPSKASGWDLLEQALDQSSPTIDHEEPRYGLTH